MGAFATVIVPHDGSRLADTAQPFAAELARATGSAVVLLRVLEERRPIFNVARRELTWFSRSTTRGELSASEILAGPLAWFKEQGLPAQPVIRFGDPRSEIVAEAAAHPRPVIVIASHGRGGLGRVLLGSVVTRVLQTAACPVFIVRARRPEQQAEAVRFRRIAVALDGSELAEQALPVAIDLARDTGAAVELIRVADTYRDEAPPEPERFLTSPAYEAMLQDFDRREAETRDYLERMTAVLREHGLDVSWHALSGDPARQILGYVEDNPPDVLLLTTHGRGGLARWVYGSVADHLLTSASVPLLLVRSTVQPAPA